MPWTPRPLPRAAPRHRLTTDERQREIVATVLALARERGPDAITTQAIADRMGVTQGALFRHFPDKEAIWLAVFAWVRESLGAVLDAAVEKADSPLAKIERAFLAHVAFIAANPGVPRVMFHEMQYPGDSPVRAEVRAMITAYRKRLALLFTQAKAAGELPARPRCDAGAGAVHRRRAGPRHRGSARRRRGRHGRSGRATVPAAPRRLSRAEKAVNLRLGRKAALIAAGIGGALLLGWLVTSQGPLAPAKVTVAKVEQGPLVASTFGIGTVEARRSYALGPTVASRVAAGARRPGRCRSRRGSCSPNSIRSISTDRVASGRTRGGARGEHDPRGRGPARRGAEPRPGRGRRAHVAPSSCARKGSSARKPPTPRRTKRMPRRPPSMRRRPNWRRRGATTNGRWPMSLASASCARRRGS